MNFPRIKRVKVKNLYGYLNKELVFPDGNISVLIGENGFGKSTILRLVDILFSLPRMPEEQISFLKNQGRDLILFPIYERLEISLICPDGDEATLALFVEKNKTMSVDIGSRNLRSQGRRLLNVSFKKNKEGTQFAFSLHKKDRYGVSSATFNGRIFWAEMQAARGQLDPGQSGLIEELSIVSYIKEKLSECASFPLSASFVQTERVVNFDYNHLVKEIISLGLNHSSVSESDKEKILGCLTSPQGRKESSEFVELLNKTSPFPLCFPHCGSDHPSIQIAAECEKRMKDFLFSDGPFFLKAIHDLTCFCEKEDVFYSNVFLDYVAIRLEKSEWSICLSDPDGVQEYLDESLSLSDAKLTEKARNIKDFFSFEWESKSFPTSMVDALKKRRANEEQFSTNDEMQKTRDFVAFMWSTRQLKYVFDNIFQNGEKRYSLAFLSSEGIGVCVGGNDGPFWNRGASQLNILSSGQFNAFKLFYEVLIGRFRQEKISNLVLIDEPEVSMHIAWQRQIMPQLKYIAETMDIQVIVATQSPFVVDGDQSLLATPK